MRIKYLLKEMKNRLSFLESSRSTLSEELIKSIDGTLYVKPERGIQRYYNRIDGEKKYIPKTNLQTIKALAQKKYETKLLVSIDMEIKILNKCLKTLSNHTEPEEVYGQLSEVIRELAKPRISKMTKDQNEWQNSTYHHKKPPESSDFVTIRKEKTRSKSETIVADRLHMHGVPYHYEELLLIGGVEPVYPDFTIIHPRTGRKIIWEHMGRMDDPEYTRECVWKINAYAREGFILGDNLIITFENKEHPLSTVQVEKNIELLLT